MRKYVIFDISKLSKALEGFNLLWQVEKAVSSPEDISTYHWGVYPHPTDPNTLAMEYDPEYFIPVDSRFDAMKLINYFAPNADAAKITEYKNYLKRTGGVKVEAIFSKSEFNLTLKTYDQVVSLGWHQEV